jgi:hypothetical protein
MAPHGHGHGSAAPASPVPSTPGGGISAHGPMSPVGGSGGGVSKKDADQAEAVAHAKLTPANGLSAADVARLTLEFGKNELPEKKKSKILQVRSRQVRTQGACTHARTRALARTQRAHATRARNARTQRAH